jgi:hypothetical protein
MVQELARIMHSSYLPLEFISCMAAADTASLCHEEKKICIYTHHIRILWVLNLSTTWWAQSGEWGHSAIAPSEARVGEYLANASDGDDDVMKRHLFFGGKLR